MISIHNLHVMLPGFSLRAVDLHVGRGEFFVLLGPTGAGKSLILESVLGNVHVAIGQIRVNGKEVTRMPPERRGIGIVYQDQALFPHLTVARNIAYGIRYLDGDREDAYRRMDALTDRLGLEDLLHRSVEHLSGGEKQRVALARALVVRPDVLLLDEPLTALDPNFRDEIRDLLKSIHEETGITVMMVTHDFTEAHYLAHRVAVIRDGVIEQIGSPEDVFRRPRTAFVAEFVGIRNVFEARLVGKEAVVEDVCFLLGRPARDGERHVAIRSEDLRVLGTATRAARDCENVFEAVATKVVHKGFVSDLFLSVHGLPMRATLTTRECIDLDIREDARLALSVDPAHVHTF